VLLLGVAGELVRRRTTGKSGGGATLGHGGSLRAREIGRGGAARRPAASAGRPAEEARAREGHTHAEEAPEAKTEAADGGGAKRLGLVRFEKPPNVMTGGTNTSVWRRMNRRCKNMSVGRTVVHLCSWVKATIGWSGGLKLQRVGAVACGSGK
jgi:hypothetical protein